MIDSIRLFESKSMFQVLCCPKLIYRRKIREVVRVFGQLLYYRDAKGMGESELNLTLI